MSLRVESCAALSVDSLVKTYGRGPSRTEAVSGLSFEVPRGQFLCVMGPSGSGKSTLLHLMAGLERPCSGRIDVEGHSLAELSEDEAAVFRRRNIGLVFQFFNLIPSLSVAENVGLSLLLEGRRLRSIEQRVDELLELVGIAHKRNRAPAELSGGEMQRVAIARALLVQPRLILADEPTGNLDSRNGDEILSLLRKSCDERGVTTVLVTHELRATSIADRVITLRDGCLEDDVRAKPLQSV